MPAMVMVPEYVAGSTGTGVGVSVATGISAKVKLKLKCLAPGECEMRSFASAPSRLKDTSPLMKPECGGATVSRYFPPCTTEGCVS